MTRTLALLALSAALLATPACVGPVSPSTAETESATDKADGDPNLSVIAVSTEKLLIRWSQVNLVTVEKGYEDGEHTYTLVHEVEGPCADAEGTCLTRVSKMHGDQWGNQIQHEGDYSTTLRDLGEALRVDPRGDEHLTAVYAWAGCYTRHVPVLLSVHRDAAVSAAEQWTFGLIFVVLIAQEIWADLNVAACTAGELAADGAVLAWEEGQALMERIREELRERGVLPEEP